MTAGRARQVGPDLPEPGLIVVGADDAEQPLAGGRAAVPARLALHEDELDVVLDDGVRLVGLAEKPAAAGNFVVRVGDLVPDDRREVVEADRLAMVLDRRMQRDDRVPAVVASSARGKRRRH